MPDYGITEDGFVRKTREEIEEDLILKTKNKMGNDFNTSDKNPWVKFLKIIAYPISLYWMALESLYNNRWIGTATGQTLDEVVQYLGIKRRSGTRAVVDLEFEGDNLTFIPEDFLVETDEKEPIQFETVESGYIEDGSVTLQAEAVEKGEDGNVSADTLTEIVNPISGLDEVNNPEEAQGGSDREEDWELRQRYYDSYDRAGGSTTTAIRANILEETDVTACLMLENITMEENDDGLPPKSFEAVVYGGVDEEVAEAILDKKPAGIEPYGEISVLVDDVSGEEKEVGFSRAEGVDIYIDIELETDDSFPSDGEEEIKEEIVDYITDDLSIADDVIYKKIIDLIFNIDGVVDVTELFIGTSSDPTGEENIEIDSREVAVIEDDWIVIS